MRDTIAGDALQVTASFIYIVGRDPSEHGWNYSNERIKRVGTAAHLETVVARVRWNDRVCCDGYHWRCHVANKRHGHDGLAGLDYAVRWRSDRRGRTDLVRAPGTVGHEATDDRIPCRGVSPRSERADNDLLRVLPRLSPGRLAVDGRRALGRDRPGRGIQVRTLRILSP